MYVARILAKTVKKYFKHVEGTSHSTSDQKFGAIYSASKAKKYL